MKALAVYQEPLVSLAKKAPGLSRGDALAPQLTLKRLGAIMRLQEFPHLLKLPSLWTRSCFASTAGNVSQATIRAYIDAQKGLR